MANINIRRPERYLNEILVKLANADEHAGEPYKVTILNSPIVNAFALPPGNVYVTRGLLALANDASEVAAVMAHEIAHITAKHALQREEEEKRAAVISQAASVIQNKQKSVRRSRPLAQRTIASFSRQQELEADQIGIKVSAKAGFDPYGAARFLGALGRSAALRGSLMSQYASAGKPDILATHPSTPDRVTQAINAARQIGAPGIGKTDRAAYLAAIDGMTFGDDPAEGAIRGRKFVHGRLGFCVSRSRRLRSRKRLASPAWHQGRRHRSLACRQRQRGAGRPRSRAYMAGLDRWIG